MEIELEGDNLTVESDVATAVAMVVNELLQNSMEHAFAGRETGTIRISLRKGKIYSVIIVQDDEHAI